MDVNFNGFHLYQTVGCSFISTLVTIHYSRNYQSREKGSLSIYRANKLQSRCITETTREEQIIKLVRIFFLFFMGSEFIFRKINFVLLYNDNNREINHSQKRISFFLAHALKWRLIFDQLIPIEKFAVT